jgi:two-component system chemotaxis response regulator CheY
MELVSEVLLDQGFQVDTAENGALAMTKLRESPPDVIVLDLMMPVVDGWEFMRRCSEMPGCGDTQILVISAGHQVEFELREGVEFLAKPFEVNELLQAIARLAASAG